MVHVHFVEGLTTEAVASISAMQGDTRFLGLQSSGTFTIKNSAKSNTDFGDDARGGGNTDEADQ